MKSIREYNYDWLRAVSMIAVIMIHVSGSYVGSFFTYVSDGGHVDELVYPLIAFVYNTISRFAVPCFIMLSGAFVLSDGETAHYKEFYQKKLMKIGVPTIVFSVLYVLYRLSLCFVGEYGGIGEVLALLKDIVVGAPFYHMWYLFMLIGIYCMAPIVVRFKDSIKYEKFRKIVFVFLILGSVSRWTADNLILNWNIGQSFEYLGYFMVGYVIREDLPKSTGKGILLIIAGGVIEIAIAFIVYQFTLVNRIGGSELQGKLVSPYCPIIVVASLLIFAGFTMLKVGYNAWIQKLAASSFTIYLIHAGVWDVLQKLIYLIKGKNYIRNLNNTYWIPIFVIIVLLLSVLLTIVYEKVKFYISSKARSRRVSD